jgi:UDP-N-acetylglucosamine 2-epimerase
MIKTRITTIVGTRPELIRLSLIIKRLDEVFQHRLVHTGQNSDGNLSDIFFKELNIRQPDTHFKIANTSLGQFLGELFPRIELEFEENMPDAILVLGDTNSSLAAMIAKRKGIPVYHLEAGNRSYDQNVPEEINRRIIDHFSDFNLAYTSHAKENLLREGIHPRTIGVIGSPLQEVVRFFDQEISSSDILNIMNLKPKEFFLASLHRQENVDSIERLSELLQTFNAVAVKYQYPIIISTHPRTKEKLKQINFEISPLLSFHEPFGYINYCKLQKESRLVLSDSGSISEESIILGFKAITVRDSIERGEALESGSIIMSGTSKNGIMDAIEIIESGNSSKIIPNEYLIPDTSTRVINFISSTIHQHRFWNGLRDN